VVGVHRVGGIGSELVVVLEELSDRDGTVDVDASGTEVGATLDVVEDVSVRVLLVDVAICAGVEVEETNGGAFSMYELSGCTA
jgi:hypothetical protein